MSVGSRGVARIGLIDYGVGNVRSLVNMFSRIGYSADICSEPNQIKAYELAILPGVGAFDHGMTQLRAAGFEEPISTWHRTARSVKVEPSRTNTPRWV